MTEERGKPVNLTSWPAMAFGGIVVYLIPLITVLIDEGVLRTFYVSRHAPEWCEQAFRSIYSPFFWMAGR